MFIQNINNSSQFLNKKYEHLIQNNKNFPKFLMKNNFINERIYFKESFDSFARLLLFHFHYYYYSFYSNHYPIHTHVPFDCRHAISARQ